MRRIGLANDRIASSNGGGLHIVDVSNQRAQRLSTIGSTIGAVDNINGFAIADDLLFASDADSDTIFAFDIADRSAPQSLGSFSTGDTIANNELLISGDQVELFNQTNGCAFVQIKKNPREAHAIASMLDHNL